jgi:hypothetical protein
LPVAVDALEHCPSSTRTALRHTTAAWWRGEPGLCFLGLWFLSAFTSSLLGGVGSDAEHVAEQIAARRPDRLDRTTLSI